MKAIAVATAVVLLAGCSSGPDHREIKEVSQQFFDAMEHRDVALAESIVIPGGAFVDVRGDPGSRTVRARDIQSWLDGLASREAEVREVFEGGSSFVMVEGDVAMLWAKYHFEVDGEPSHEGMDIFNFVRTDDGWKLAGGVYSVEPVD